MTLKISTYVLGPLENNTYLLADSTSSEAVIIDPALGSEAILADVQRKAAAVSARVPSLDAGVMPIRCATSG